MTKPIYLIVASDEKGAIGYRGELPWNIPDDWDFFLESTRNGILIMGRICYESMRCSDVFPLADRTYIVISSSLSPQQETHVHVVSGIPQALKLSEQLSGRIWVCGGVDIYRRLLPKADYLVMTHIEAVFPADRFFPAEWKSYFPNRLEFLPRRDAGYRYSFNLYASENPIPGFYSFSELNLDSGSCG